MLLRSLVAMYPCCKSYVKTNLASLHSIAFNEPLTARPIQAMFFNSEQFMNNSIKVIEAKK
jgi:hypothetical protein